MSKLTPEQASAFMEAYRAETTTVMLHPQKAPQNESGWQLSTDSRAFDQSALERAKERAKERAIMVMERAFIEGFPPQHPNSRCVGIDWAVPSQDEIEKNDCSRKCRDIPGAAECHRRFVVACQMQWKRVWSAEKARRMVREWKGARAAVVLVFGRAVADAIEDVYGSPGIRVRELAEKA